MTTGTIWRIVRRVSLAIAAAVAVLGATFGISYTMHAGDYPVPATTAKDPSLPARVIGGYRYHLETFGVPNHPVVVAIHGGPGNDYRYILSLRALADEYHVVFYDQRGSGLSPRVPDAELHVDQFVRDLHEVVGHFSPNTPVRLVGHSWGGMLAAAYIERYPHRVSHAVLAEPGFLTAELAARWMSETNGGMPPLTWPIIKVVWSTFMESLHVDGPDDDAQRDYLMTRLASAVLPGLPLNRYYCNEDVTTGVSDSWRLGARAMVQVPAASMNDAGEIAMDLVGAVAKGFPRKVLFIASRCNTLIGIDIQREHQKLFGKSELAIVEDAGHTMFGEQPEVSMRIIRSYLGEVHRLD